MLNMDWHESAQSIKNTSITILLIKKILKFLLKYYEIYLKEFQLVLKLTFYKIYLHVHFFQII